MIPMNFKCFVLFVIIFISADLCSSKSLIAPNKVTTPPAPADPKRVYTCVCEDKQDPVCANNGVTYPNKCRFECAASKMEKLKIIQQGNCSKYISKLNYNNFGK